MEINKTELARQAMADLDFERAERLLAEVSDEHSLNSLRAKVAIVETTSLIGSYDRAANQLGQAVEVVAQIETAEAFSLAEGVLTDAFSNLLGTKDRYNHEVDVEKPVQEMRQRLSELKSQRAPT